MSDYDDNDDYDNDDYDNDDYDSRLWLGVGVGDEPKK